MAHKAKPLAGGIDLNYEVVGGTTPPTTFKKENTIWVNTDIPITEHIASYENLYNQTIVRNYEEGLAQQKMNSAGALASDVAWYMTVYYPIFKDAQYYLTFTETGACSGYYDKDYAFISSFDVVGNTWTSLPSIPSNAAYVRFCIRVYSDADDRTKFQYRYTESHANTGTVWIQTDIDKAPVSFNAIKKNKLMIYPYKLKRWDNSGWEALAGTLYRNGISTQIYTAEKQLFPNGSNWEAITIGSQWGISSATPTNITIYSVWYNYDTYANVVTSEAIDLTSYTTLSATFTITGLGAYSDCYNYWYIGVNPTKGGTTTQWNGKTISGTSNGNTTYTITFDISNLTGKYYVYFGGQYNHSNANCKVQSIILE